MLGIHRPRRRLQRGYRLPALHGRQGEESTRGPRVDASKDSRFLPHVGQFPELVGTRTGRRQEPAEIELHLRQLVKCDKKLFRYYNYYLVLAKWRSSCRQYGG